jgi:hypothetical protein
MKFHHRFFGAVVLAVAVSLPSVALAVPLNRERGAEKTPIVRIAQKLRKFFGISTHNDFPVPPVPSPDPNPTP